MHSFVRKRHTVIASDAIKALDTFRRKNQKFDIVLADPPSFSHSSEGVWSVEGDLQKLVNACLRVVAEKGLLIVASNHGKLSPKEFSKAIIQAARKVQRRWSVPRLVHRSRFRMFRGAKGRSKVTPKSTKIT